MFNTKLLVMAAGSVTGLILSSPAQAIIEFDQDVTNNVIMGTGIGNGSFTTDRANGVELALRGKLRFDAAGNPQPIYNSNSDGTYTFQAGNTPFGFSFAQPPTTTPVWNFEWSINSGTVVNLDALTYELGIDFDPGAGTNFLTFDPINVAEADHGIGTNATLQSQGVEAANAVDYANLIANNNLAQNSWNMEFFNNAPFDLFDPNVEGTYDFYITASDGGNELARVDIQIITVPEPASLGLLSLGGLAILKRKRA